MQAPVSDHELYKFSAQFYYGNLEMLVVTCKSKQMASSVLWEFERCWRISMRAHLRLRGIGYAIWMSPSTLLTGSFVPKVSRLNDDEMKRLMIDVVDRTNHLIDTWFDE